MHHTYRMDQELAGFCVCLLRGNASGVMGCRVVLTPSALCCVSLCEADGRLALRPPTSGAPRDGAGGGVLFEVLPTQKGVAMLNLLEKKFGKS